MFKRKKGEGGNGHDTASAPAPVPASAHAAAPAPTSAPATAPVSPAAPANADQTAAGGNELEISFDDIEEERAASPAPTPAPASLSAASATPHASPAERVGATNVPPVSKEGLPADYFYRLVEAYGYPRNRENLARQINNEPALRAQFCKRHPVAAYFAGRFSDQQDIIDAALPYFLDEWEKGHEGRGAGYLFSAYWNSQILGDDKLKAKVGERSLETAPHLAYKVAKELRNDALADAARERLANDPLLGVMIGWIHHDEPLVRDCAERLVDTHLSVAWKAAKQFDFSDIKERITEYVMGSLEKEQQVSLQSRTATAVEAFVRIFGQ